MKGNLTVFDAEWAIVSSFGSITPGMAAHIAAAILAAGPKEPVAFSFAGADIAACPGVAGVVPVQVNRRYYLVPASWTSVREVVDDLGHQAEVEVLLKAVEGRLQEAAVIDDRAVEAAFGPRKEDRFAIALESRSLESELMAEFYSRLALAQK